MGNSWKDKPVLVTGADGFIGSHLTEALVQKGARVRALVYYNSFGRWGWIDHLPPGIRDAMEVFPGDIRDSGRTLDAVEGNAVVFHLASLIAIPYSYHAPESYIQTNVMGGINILNACRRCGVERLIHTSTSEVYGTAQYVTIDEKHPLQGQSPYSASKIAADMMAESYYRSFDLPVSIIRPFNTYGPRQSARAVIPTIMSQLFAGADRIKLGSLTPTRDFNYVSDTVSGFLSAAESTATIGRVVNIGSGREIAIGDLVEMIFRITGKYARVITDSQRIRPEKSEVERLLCDNTQAVALTGWKPSHTLEAGLEATAQWIREHPEAFQTTDYCI
jgi:dTDP-glucose 4,6-dehydratase